jgi:hypothetical protein
VVNRQYPDSSSAAKSNDGTLARSNPRGGRHTERGNPGMHTTDTVDVDIVLSGEIVLELDDDAEKPLPTATSSCKRYPSSMAQRRQRSGCPGSVHRQRRSRKLIEVGREIKIGQPAAATRRKSDTRPRRHSQGRIPQVPQPSPGSCGKTCGNGPATARPIPTITRIAINTITGSTYANRRPRSAGLFVSKISRAGVNRVPAGGRGAAGCVEGWSGGSSGHWSEMS